MKKLLVMFLIVSVCALAEEPNVLPLPVSGNVTLPLAEYNRLVDLAHKSVKIYEQPPIPYTIKRADLKLRINNEAVIGTMLLDGEVFSKSAAKVPLASGVTILNAHQEGKALPLLQEGAVATAVLPGASDFSVTLDAGVPLAIEAGRASFSLPVPAAGSVRLSLVIPGDHTNIRISPGLITSRNSANGQTTIEATLVPAQTANIWWATREIAMPTVPREVRFLSDVKTLVSVTETDLRIAALADVTVVQGEPAQFSIEIPSGYAMTNASGATVESSELKGETLLLNLNSSSQKTHQFLISMERPLTATKADAPFITFKDAQRETGEVLVEGAGAMELTATEGGSLKRMDVKEVNPYLRSLAHNPLQAAFRYHRQPNEAPSLALGWTRFPDSAVLAAVAERAVVTTLVTSEGRSLTEVTLTVKNQAQPFMKVALPAGATILSADVAGEKVKPVQGPDGNRVPLLRANFRPNGPYTVSFVFMHSGTPFARKGGSELDLPGMDVPISVLQWEVFLPDQYKVKDFGGDAIALNLLPQPVAMMLDGEYGPGEKDAMFHVPAPAASSTSFLLPGQVGGVVVDPSGAVVPGARVKITSVERGITKATTSDTAGNWVISNMPSGTIKIQVEAQGFKTAVYANTPFDAGRPSRYSIPMSVAAATETVEITSAAPTIETSTIQVITKSGRNEKKDRIQDAAQNNASQNVFDLQKKVAGVLPVRVDVPRTGTSYRFARALVLDEETKVTFNYKTR